jgi:hypothetical protein
MFKKQSSLLSDVPTVAIGDAVGVDKGVSYAKFKVHDDMVSHLLYIPTVERVRNESSDCLTLRLKYIMYGRYIDSCGFRS